VVKVEVEAPKERVVVIEMTESEAYVLKEILGFVYLANPNQPQGDFLPELHNTLLNSGVVNGGRVGINMTNRGIRIYDMETEW